MTHELGSSEYEQQRLRLQAQLSESYTMHFLQSAGIESGQRVLDIGCGAGDVSHLLATLVGSTGQVVGIDAEPQMVELSRNLKAASWNEISNIQQ